MLVGTPRDAAEKPTVPFGPLVLVIQPHPGLQVVRESVGNFWVDLPSRPARLLASCTRIVTNLMPMAMQ